MNEITTSTVYFRQPGRENTQRTLELAKQRADVLGLTTALVASTTGYTGKLAVDILKGMDIIVVTHVAGLREPNTQELTAENRAAFAQSGARTLTAQHTLGGVNSAVRKAFSTYELDDIIANVLRIFGQGMKVIFEIAMMAADAGLVKSGEPVLAVAGTGRGADMAAVVSPANSFRFFDLKVLELVCLPSQGHPEFK